MKKAKTHYYSNHSVDENHWDAACGRDVHKVGGLIDVFFRMTKIPERCKTCDKIFEKEQNEEKVQKTK